MAVRQVSIRVALTGYDEYKATVTRLNQQNELLKQELKLIDAQYRNTGNASEYTRQKAEALAKQYDLHVEKLRAIEAAIKSGEADREKYRQQMVETEDKLKKATKALEDAKNSGTASKEEIKQLTNAQAEANKEYTEAKAKYEAAGKGLYQLELAAGKEKIAIEDSAKAIKDNNEALTQMEPKVKDAVDIMAEMLVAEKVASSIKKVADALWDCIEASMSYEQAFANVTKTVNGTAEDFALLDKNIRDMASRLPQSAEEIAQVASTAGQLGIATEDISNFTEVMLGLGTATDMTANDAATLLAQFQNVTKFDPSKIANIASVIVDLGNNSATTESNIMNMAQRMSAAGVNAGLSAQDILGMAAALTSVGIRAEAGGSSISNMFNKIDTAVLKGGDDLDAYAKVAGTTAEKFAKVWREEPIEAIQMFITGLSSGSESASQMLNELGITEIRLRNSLLSLANGEDVLRKSVQRANKAFKDTAALDTEVGRFLDTTQNKSNILKNNVENLKTSIGDALRPAIENLIDTATPLIKGLTEYIQKNPEVVQCITVVITAIGAMTAGIVAYKAAVAIANTVTAVFGATLEATPAGLITSAILGLVAALGLFSMASQDAVREAEAVRLVGYDVTEALNGTTQAFKDTIGSIDDVNTVALGYIDRLEELDKKTNLTNDEQLEYNRLLEELQTLLPDLDIKIDEKTGKIKDGTQALRDQIKAWKDRAKAEAYHNTLVELYQKENDLQREYKSLVEDNARLEKERNAIEERQSFLLARREELTWRINKTPYPDWNQYYIDLENIDRKIAELDGDLTEVNIALESNSLGLEQNAEDMGKVQRAIDGATDSYEKVKTAGFDVDMLGPWKEWAKNVPAAILAGTEDAKQAAIKYAKAVKKAVQDNLGSLKYTATVRVTGNSAALQFTPQPFAKGGIITRPTMALMGEAGTEAVLPIEKLEPMITNAMAMYEHNRERDADFRALKARAAVRQEPQVNIVEEFKKALSEMKVELDDTEMGAFVDKTVTKSVYAI